MKKKIVSVALVIVLLTIIVGGSLAYFADTDQVNNTFTIGSVRIDIWENGAPTDDDKVTFQKPLLPVLDEQDVTNDPSYAQKVVKVKNTGKNDAYIRTHIAIPTALVGYLHLDLDATGWIQQTDTTATVDGVAYKVFTYVHEAAVSPNDFTAELLKGAYLGSAVDIKDNPGTPAADLEFCLPDGNGGYTFSGFVAHRKTADGYASNAVCILVAAEAIQMQTFETIGATAALDAGFGTGTNPWK